jgi:hypothetical protein
VGFLVAVAFLEKRRRRLVLVLSAMADLLGFLRAVGRYLRAMANHLDFGDMRDEQFQNCRLRIRHAVGIKYANPDIT